MMDMATSLLKLTSSSSILEDLEGVTCPICLDIYEKPRNISCGHTFCKNCLSNYEDIVEPACPLCRQLFKPAEATKAADVDKMISSSKGACKGCEKKIALTKLRAHHATCEKLAYQATNGKESSIQINTRPSKKENATNRHTFRCPYCGLQNLDTNTLLQHVNSLHARNAVKVVCPVCASMPWGDPNQKSTNFIAHLNLRHRFEYDTLVDFELDDDAALQKALKESLESK